MINNKKLNTVVTELFIRGRKRNISIVYTEYYTLLHKIPDKGELNKLH